MDLVSPIRESVEQFIQHATAHGRDELERLLVELQSLAEQEIAAAQAGRTMDARRFGYLKDTIVLRVGMALESYTDESKVLIAAIVVSAIRAGIGFALAAL
jgi:hypothetical protein